MKRKLYALVDCNTFYASCERLFRPDLNGRPVIVLSNNDGCVVALTKEAKELGICRGDPLFQIRDIVEKNNVAFFSSNYELYGDISKRVMEVLKTFSPDIEVYSIDEAFLRIDYFDRINEYAREIRNTVKKWTGMPVSVGVGETKTLAKLANHIGKKYAKFDGCFNITDYKEKRDIIFKHIAVEKVWGIGPQYRKKLNSFGIFTIYDLLLKDNYWIKKNLTIGGLLTVEELRGERYIELEKAASGKKSIVSSRSFGQAVTTVDQMKEAVAAHITEATDKLRKQHSVCSSLGIFFGTNRFKNSRQHYAHKVISLRTPTNYPPTLTTYAHKVVEQEFKEGCAYKRCGILLNEIIPLTYLQFDLFETRNNRACTLIKTIDSINTRYGKNCVQIAGKGVLPAWTMKREHLSPGYTTRWSDLPVVYCD